MTREVFATTKTDFKETRSDSYCTIPTLVKEVLFLQFLDVLTSEPKSKADKKSDCVRRILV